MAGTTPRDDVSTTRWWRHAPWSADEAIHHAWIRVLSIATLAAGLLVALFPLALGLDRYGIHDHDSQAAYRAITVESLRLYGEFPWWHPFMCGGFPAFAFAEGAGNLVSPYLPLYAFFSVPTAMRMELAGNTVLAAAGAWVLARHGGLKHPGAALVAALYALNSRWMHQAAAGHMWHLQYAWIPWIVWAFRRATSADGRRHVVTLGALLAATIYLCGIYPAPHAVVLLGVLTLHAVFTQRSLRPVSTLVGAGVLGVLLSAPKLLAVADLMQRVPRKAGSSEAINHLQLWHILTGRVISFMNGPTPVPEHGWHEYGMYVGITGALLLLAGLFASRNADERAHRMAAWIFLVLGMGAFHVYAPWTLLHMVPPFSSHHVPSRFLLVALLLAGLNGALALQRFTDLRLRARQGSWILLALAMFVAVDLGLLGRKAMGETYSLQLPDVPRQETFHHRVQPPARYIPANYQSAMIPAMRANTGVMRCYYVPRQVVPGALPQDGPGYRGEAYLPDGNGSARVVEWSFNRAVIEVEGANPGALLVYNMNWDTSWTANGQPAEEYQRAVSARVAAGTTRVEFRYRPRTLPVSLSLFAVGALAAFVTWRRRRAVS